MKITKLTKLRNGLYEIDLDETHHFKFSEDVIIRYNLYSDKQISDEDLKLFDSLEKYSKHYTSALNYLSYKMRSVYEVETYLTEKGCVSIHIQEIIEKLKKLNYLNDENYCDVFVKHQFFTNKKGPLRIKNELMEKHIKESWVDARLNQITQQDQEDMIEQLVHHFEKLNRHHSLKKLKEQILKNLLQKGFVYDTILAVLSRYAFETQHEETQYLTIELNKVAQKLSRKYTQPELKNRIIKHLLNKGFIYEDIMNELHEYLLEG